MIDILENIKYVLESYKLGNVSSGYTKIVGGVINPLAVPLTDLINRKIGETVRSTFPGAKQHMFDPNSPADLNNPFHRVGIISDRSHGPTQYASAGVGAVMGGIGSNLLKIIKSRINDEDYEFNPSETATNVTGGAAIGYGSSVSTAAYKQAGKIGYGRLGKIGAAIAPFAGLTKPKHLNQINKFKK